MRNKIAIELLQNNKIINKQLFMFITYLVMIHLKVQTSKYGSKLNIGRKKNPEIYSIVLNRLTSNKHSLFQINDSKISAFFEES